MTDTRSLLHRKLAGRLVLIFLAWKALFFLLAVLSPGPGYDTSALILLNPSRHRHRQFRNWTILDRFTLNHLRWDALYFVKTAQRGYVHEQEWAFSWAYSMVLETTGKFLSRNAKPSLQHYVWAGIVVSNLCHLSSVLVLFRLLNVVLGPEQNVRIPFIASVLHILSPAGMFLSAPYSEAFFAALNFTGMLHYVQAKRAQESSKNQAVRADALLLSSGVVFAGATLVRSNGLLSGLIFAYDVARYLPRACRFQLNRIDIRRIAVTCVAGSLVAVGYFLPQYVAYREYCVTKRISATRPWCQNKLPSIYSWVQVQYWNVGFLRYWNLSNLPLFLIAAPMLWLLFKSGVAYLRHGPLQPSTSAHIPPPSGNESPNTFNSVSCGLPQLALPQLVLVIMAATTFHVQIINRISSGYPVWYLALAQRMAQGRMAQVEGKTKRVPQWLVRGFIMYAIMQGTLFASFLPPA